MIGGVLPDVLEIDTGKNQPDPIMSGYRFVLDSVSVAAVKDLLIGWVYLFGEGKI